VLGASLLENGNTAHFQNAVHL